MDVALNKFSLPTDFLIYPVGTMSCFLVSNYKWLPVMVHEKVSKSACQKPELLAG